MARRDFDKAVGGVTHSISGGRLSPMVRTLLPRRPFGIRLATQEAKGPDEHQLPGPGIMNVLVQSANVKYAVIQVSSKPDSAGQLVLAYRDEQSLRHLIAERSIIALGFAHPEEAAALVASNFTKSIASGGMEQELRVKDYRKCNLRFPSWKRGLAAEFGGWKHRSLAYSVVQFAFASAVLVLYSKNIVSSTIRIILGI